MAEHSNTTTNITTATTYKVIKLTTIAIISCTLLLETFYFKTYTSKIFAVFSPPSRNNTNSTNVNDSIQTLTKMDDDTPRPSASLLAEMGLESAELHDFKSPYIITPSVYDNSSWGTKNNGRRKKIISFHLVKEYNNWFINTRRHNQDFKNCPYSECELDTEGKLKDKADLVLFICKGLRSPPLKRPAGQLWALGCWESDVHWNYPDYPLWKDAFNVTFSYRMDADVFSPYRKLAWRDRSRLTLKEEDYLAIARNKTKTATWWASNCNKARLNFVREMQKHIDIDIYGGCGPLKCSRVIDTSCLKMLNTTYKFYLGFENSICHQYVTEKLIKVFHIESYTHTIPVVKGGLDYENQLPNMTFVNGNDFKSAKELALHLKEIASDDKRYARMLQEKDKLVSPIQRMPDWCDVCKMLHTKKFGVYRDIRKNWSHNTCKKGY